MSGQRTSSDPRLDALIERGLERYGEGDLDGALADWTSVLAEDPDNRRATEYVDYVRQNYELLDEQFRAARDATDDSAALGIPLGHGPEDLDAYDLVELEEGARPPSQQPASPPRAHVEAVDEGWSLGEETSGADSLPPPPAASAPQRGLTAELDLSTVADDVMGEPGAADEDPREDDEAAYQDGIIEFEADYAEEGARGGFELEAAEIAAGGLELMDEPADHVPGRAATDGLDFGSPGLTQERTVELRTEHLDPVAGTEAAADDDEITVPGGDEPPPFGAELALSDQALEALGAAGVSPRDGRTRRPDETTAERSTLASGFAMSELDELDLASPRDDRAEDHSEVKVTFRSEGTGAGPLGGRQHDDDDGELTVERPSARAAGTTDRSPEAGSAELDDELTRERDAGSWDRDLLSLGDDLGEDATREHRAVEPGLADTLEVGTIDLGMPSLDPAADSGAWRRASTEEATAELRSRADFDDAAAQQTADLPGIDIGMAPLTDESMSMDAISAELDREIDRDAPADESPDDRTRRRVAALIKRAESEANLGHPPRAVTALDMALEEDPDSAVAQKVIHRHRDLMFDIYRGYIGDMQAMPTLAIPLHQLAQERLDNRAAFLLSRIDGSLSFEEILDVSGMTRLEAYRLLSRMLLRGILEVH